MRGFKSMGQAQRFQAEFGYGLNGSRGRALWMPFVSAEAGQGGRQSLRMGLNLTSGSHVEAGFEIGQRESDRVSRAAGWLPIPQSIPKPTPS